MFGKKNSARDMMYEWAHYRDEAANHQLLIAAAFWIIWVVLAEECSSLTENMMQIRCSAHSVILNLTATQYTYSLSGIYHWLVQWSCCPSLMLIPVHSPCLPGYINVQTILIILTMVGLFLNRPCIHSKRYMDVFVTKYSNFIVPGKCRQNIRWNKMYLR